MAAEEQREDDWVMVDKDTPSEPVPAAGAYQYPELGGGRWRAGDWVVDGSVKSQLEQLVGALGS